MECQLTFRPVPDPHAEVNLPDICEELNIPLCVPAVAILTSYSNLTCVIAICNAMILEIQPYVFILTARQYEVADMMV